MQFDSIVCIKFHHRNGMIMIQNVSINILKALKKLKYITIQIK